MNKGLMLLHKIHWYHIATFIIALVVIIGVIYKDKVIKTVLFYPNYNPFEPENPIATIENSRFDAYLKTHTFGNESTLVRTLQPLNSTTKRNCIIYLPPHFSTHPDNPYKFIMMLHGSPGSEIDWIEAGNAQQTLDDLINSHTIAPAIVVFPDGNGGLDNDTQYINASDSSENNEDLLSTTIPNFARQHFMLSQNKLDWTILGLSSGGFGALNIGLKHQDVFGEIIVMSGYGAIEENGGSNALIQGNQNTITANSPASYIPSLTTTSTHIYQTVGEQDGLLEDNNALHTLLEDNQFDVTYQTFEGSHNWSFWSDRLPYSLEWLQTKYPQH